MIAALLLGLAGSLHCVGMCGPLLLALPLTASDRLAAVRQMLIYHAGRILMYAALGLLLGLLGKGLMLAGFQKILSIGAAIVMFGMAFASVRMEWLIGALPGFGQFTRRVQQAIGQRLRDGSVSGTFSVGMLNGLLPCGMVYAALAGAISTAEGANGSLFMVAFGLGTLPLLLGAHWLGSQFRQSVRFRLKKLQPILLVLVGLLLLQRGLHLDLSLFESAVPKATLDCH